MGAMGEQRCTSERRASRPSGAGLGPGTVLRKTYRLVRPLASGGMGEVYLARHERLPGRFAVKILHPELLRDEDAMARFRGEAEIMAGLRHPNIVQVLDFDLASDGTPYLVMELVEGRDLSDVLREGRAFAPARVAHIVRQIASALETAHAHGVVHRDLKPENVMLLSLDGQEDFVKVVDFGVSKARWSQRITGDFTIVGTPQFMAPEQAQGRRQEIDHRTDQFALAAIAYTLLGGREPFRGDTAVTILYQVVHQHPEPLRELLGWPDDRLDSVLRRGMAKDRDARFPSVLAFARALEEALADARLAAPPAPPIVVDLAAAPAALTERGTRPEDRPTVALRPQARWTTSRITATVLGTAAAAVMVYSLQRAAWSDVHAAASSLYHHAAATARAASRWGGAAAAAAIAATAAP